MRFWNPLHPFYFSQGPFPEWPDGRGRKDCPSLASLLFTNSASFLNLMKRWCGNKPRQLSFQGSSTAVMDISELQESKHLFLTWGHVHTQLWVNPAFLLIDPLVIWLILSADVYPFLHRIQPVLESKLSVPYFLLATLFCYCYSRAATYAKALLQGIPINGIKD